jgi:hypothetical protein
MQFILTKEELEAHRQPEIDERDKALAFMSAKLVPDGECIHDKLNKSYCDDCPLAGLNEGREFRNYMCTRHRYFSK